MSMGLGDVMPLGAWCEKQDERVCRSCAGAAHVWEPGVETLTLPSSELVLL